MSYIILILEVQEKWFVVSWVVTSCSLVHEGVGVTLLRYNTDHNSYFHRRRNPKFHQKNFGHRHCPS